MKMKALAGLITALFIASMLSTAYAQGDPDLVADQTWTIGTVTVANDATYLHVTYTITESDLYLIELHLAVVSDTPWPSSLVNKGINPKVGQFPYQEPWSPPAYGDQTPTTYTFDIPLADIPEYTGPGDTIYIAAQADVGLWGDDGYGNWVVVFEETAWGSGTGFGGGNWAMYITYTLVT